MNETNNKNFLLQYIFIYIINNPINNLIYKHMQY